MVHDAAVRQPSFENPWSQVPAPRHRGRDKAALGAYLTQEDEPDRGRQAPVTFGNWCRLTSGTAGGVPTHMVWLRPEADVLMRLISAVAPVEGARREFTAAIAVVSDKLFSTRLDSLVSATAVAKVGADMRRSRLNADIVATLWFHVGSEVSLGASNLAQHIQMLAQWRQRQASEIAGVIPVTPPSQAVQARPPWIKLLEVGADAHLSDKALEGLFDGIWELVDRQEFDSLNVALASARFELMPPIAITALLRYSLNTRSRLAFWGQLLSQAQRVLATRGLDATKLLHGLDEL